MAVSKLNQHENDLVCVSWSEDRLEESCSVG